MVVGLAHLLPSEKPERNAQLKVSSHVGRRSDGGHSDHSPELETTVHGHRKKTNVCSPPFSVSITWIRKAKHLFQTETLYLVKKKKKKKLCVSLWRSGLNEPIQKYPDRNASNIISCIARLLQKFCLTDVRILA
jgi:hypothetical protein